MKFNFTEPDVASYGIDTNDNLAREGTTVCMPPQISRYPLFACNNGPPYDATNCEPVNGGSPQLANLSAHLEAWAHDIEQMIPDPAARTLVSVDWEKWGADWEATMPDMREYCSTRGPCQSKTAPGTACKYCAKYFVYGEVARGLARAARPNATDEQIEAEAKAGWEAAAVEFLSRSMDVARALRPNCTWGYWDM